MYKILLFLFFAGVSLAQVKQEDYQKAKDALAEQAILINELKKANDNLNNQINAFVKDLQSIPEPSDSLKGVLKKYGILKEEKSKTD